ncbi:ribonuclease H-like domain, reverse transcriptase, RNA-dependent DNA polymerase, partial [Tanacetum coccineum]
AEHNWNNETSIPQQQQEGTVHATIPATVQARVPVIVDATVHGQNSRMAIVHSPNHSPQTPTTVTDEDESEDDHIAIPEEVYVVQPKGFEKSGEEKKVYKLVKSLYGLRKAPKAWNIKLDNTLKEIGFQQCMQEKAVYKAVTNEEFIVVAVYVDDLFVTRTSLDCINEFKKRMASQFEMSDLGELTYYLGIEVLQGNDCVEIKQERYAMKILKEAGMEDCNATLCPIELGLKLSKAEDEPKVEATQYRKMVGCL